MAESPLRVYAVYLMTTEQCQMEGGPRTDPTDLTASFLFLNCRLTYYTSLEQLTMGKCRLTSTGQIQPVSCHLYDTIR